MTAKRKYVRLTPSVWAEIRALWEIGDVTLPELSDRYGVSIRALQTHFTKHKVEKGSKATALAQAVKAEVYAADLSDQDVLVKRARDIRESTYQRACTIEGVVMATLEAMQKDPSGALGLSSKLKSLSLAAASLERTHAIKLRALGLDKGPPISEELPVLVIRDLVEEEVSALQQADEEDEADPFASATIQPPAEDGQCDRDDDDIVVEGEPEPAAKDTVPRDAEGFRIVRDAS